MDGTAKVLNTTETVFLYNDITYTVESIQVDENNYMQVVLNDHVPNLVNI